MLNMAFGGCFYKKSQILLEKKFNFFLLHLNLPCCYCSIDLKGQSEHSGLGSDTSSLVCHLDSKFYPFLNFCSDFRSESNGICVLGVGFFSSDKFRLFN